MAHPQPLTKEEKNVIRRYYKGKATKAEAMQELNLKHNYNSFHRLFHKYLMTFVFKK